ncbi:hypothetical protein [Nostoc sp.]|uniref:hypothetical protein n=1 Tax=Nostoc sp. TaxID=1180 RepID=UPI002FF679CB
MKFPQLFSLSLSQQSLLRKKLPVSKGGQNVHPTSSSNLFFSNLLDAIATPDV